MLKKIKILLAGLLAAASIAFSPGCAQLGVPQPQTAEERVVVTLASLAAVRDSTAVLLKAGKISADDAENVQKQADHVRTGVVLARSMTAVDPAGADAKLRQTMAALAALQAYLATKEKK